MNIHSNIIHLQKKISIALAENQRSPASLLLLAVSKGQNTQAIASAFDAGIRDFGENYWQEALIKIKHFAEFPILWHIIGSIQSNKAAQIAQSVHWVHTLDREKIARLLSTHRPTHLAPLNVCIEINLDEESSKSGISCQEALDFAQFVSTLPRLKLRGLMAIPTPVSDPDLQYQRFLHLAQLLSLCNEKIGLEMDTLSMGMSADYCAAIRAGSTIIRIGQAIFGPRAL